ncbi:MAG: DNA-3-methyladenine glycosylase 2 family protein, partial [Planctomycetota bacterium]
LPRTDNETPLAERLCRAVAGQQLSTKAAATIWGRVVQSRGRRTLVNHVAAADIEQLRECGLSGSKAKAMKAIVAAEREGVLDVKSLKQLRHAERSARLTSIWGVGQWTADMIGMFYFRDADIWPASDITVWKTLQRLTNEDTDHTLTAQEFAPHRTYLALYMYAIKDASPE